MQPLLPHLTHIAAQPPKMKKKRPKMQFFCANLGSFQLFKIVIS